MSTNDIATLCIVSIPAWCVTVLILRIAYRQWLIGRRYKKTAATLRRPLEYLLQEGFVMIVTYDNDRGGKSYVVRVGGDCVDVINLTDGRIVNLITGERREVTADLIERYGVDKSTGIL